MYTWSYSRIHINSVANLKDALSTHMANVHMAMVGASEHYELDPDSGILHRRLASPKSLRPHLTVITDDLYHAYIAGVKTTDYSYPSDQPGRNFRCKVILLFWTGDYPAQALVSGTHSKTCHWCHFKSTHAPEVSRQCWGDYRCYLPDNHPVRHNAKYGPPEDRPAPLPRTHQDFLDAGVRSDTYNGPKNRAPYKDSGIKETSPLAVLPLFNLTWDVLGDMMHIIDGIWKRHVFAMLAGRRLPAKPKPRSSWTLAANRKLAKDHAKVIALLESWQVTPEMIKVICVLYIYI